MELTYNEIQMLISLIQDEVYNYGEKYFKRYNTTSQTLLNKLRGLANEVITNNEFN